MKTATSEINSKLVNGREQYLLEHMLGAGSQYAKKKWGFRNRFVTSSYTVEGRMLLAMESRGLVLSHKLEVDGLVFTATELGCKAIGLHDAAIKRAIK